jgi:hypothetical protein
MHLGNPELVSWRRELCVKSQRFPHSDRNSRDFIVMWPVTITGFPAPRYDYNPYCKVREEGRGGELLSFERRWRLIREALLLTISCLSLLFLRPLKFITTTRIRSLPRSLARSRAGRSQPHTLALSISMDEISVDGVPSSPKPQERHRRICAGRKEGTIGQEQ